MAYTERVQVMLDPELLEQVKREAEARGLGLSALIRWALLSFFGESKESRLVDTREPYHVGEPS